MIACRYANSWLALVVANNEDIRIPQDTAAALKPQHPALRKTSYKKTPSIETMCLITITSHTDCTHRTVYLDRDANHKRRYRGDPNTCPALKVNHPRIAGFCAKCLEKEIGKTAENDENINK
jgi:hypothetical protein